MTCFLCRGCCAVDRCDECGERICEQHMAKRGNLLFCDTCLPWSDAVTRWSAAQRIARRVAPKFAQYAAQDEIARLEAEGWTKQDFAHALTELLETR